MALGLLFATCLVAFPITLVVWLLGDGSVLQALGFYVAFGWVVLILGLVTAALRPERRVQTCTTCPRRSVIVDVSASPN